MFEGIDKAFLDGRFDPPHVKIEDSEEAQVDLAMWDEEMAD